MWRGLRQAGKQTFSILLVSDIVSLNKTKQELPKDKTTWHFGIFIQRGSFMDSVNFWNQCLSHTYGTV